jgi:TolB protein
MRFLPRSFAWVLTLTVSVHAQITIVKTAGTTLDLQGVSIPSTADGVRFRQILEKNLARSGWITLVEKEAAWPVTGSFTPPASAVIEIRSAGYRRTFSRRDGNSRRLAQEIADALVESLTGRKGMARTRLALAGNRTGHWELYLCDADGENLQQITRDRSMALYPYWSPDGSRLVFTSYRSRFPDLYLLTIGTWKLEPLARFNGLNTGGAFSPDGQAVAVSLSFTGNPELYVLRPPVHGGRLFRLTQTPQAAETSPSWSPDGQRLVFVSDSSGSPQLYMMSARGGERTRIPISGTENVSPSWGPDGRIAFVTRRGGVYRIAIYSPDSGEVQLVTDDDAQYEDPAWAPNGRHLACTRISGNRMTVVLLDTITRRWIPFLDIEGSWRSPAWSPLLP